MELGDGRVVLLVSGLVYSSSMVAKANPGRGGSVTRPTTKVALLASSAAFFPLCAFHALGVGRRGLACAVGCSGRVVYPEPHAR
jgi:hypothetical protein